MTDYSFTSGTAAPSLAPQEALGRLVGTDPNGVWKLRVWDQQIAGTTGRMESAWVRITALPQVSTLSFVTQEDAPAVPAMIPIGGLTRTLGVATPGTSIYAVSLRTNITHTANGDLDVTLTSPRGTVVTVTTKNGGTLDDVFAGTTWVESATRP